jgi:hypothetical protein
MTDSLTALLRALAASLPNLDKGEKNPHNVSP